MKKNTIREDVLRAVEHVEHPEIASTLGDLGMILDVSIQGSTATVAVALPIMGIPEAIKNTLIDRIRQQVYELGLQLAVEFFEMNEEVRNQFLTIARAKWKGSL